MNWLLLSRLLGLLGMLVGGSMVFALPWAFPGCGVANTFETQGFWGIVSSIGISLTVGGCLFYVGRKAERTIFRKEALAVVGLGWILAGILGSLPFLLSRAMIDDSSRMTFVDALFESVSGFTTTGASAIKELEHPSTIPRCVLFWRSFTHWLGGMGIIVLFVAILGQLGAGGKALMKREVPGPINETVRPRVRETAMVMWAIYVGISVTLVVTFLVEGMSLFDALCHCFGTMATGGFSTYNSSVGHFKSLPIELTIIVFMIVAGANFSLYYAILKSPLRKEGNRFLVRFSPLMKDPEFRVYILILAVATLLITVSLFLKGDHPSLGESLRHASFAVVSIMTTTGFGTVDFHLWNEFSKGLLLLLMFVGGCAGSTGGGIKVIRVILFQKIVRLEIEQAFRPKVVRPIKIFGTTLDESLRHEVVVYFGLVLVIFISSWMILAAIEPETQWTQQEHTKAEKLLDCASAVAATLNNVGPGLGVLGPHSNYSDFSQQGKLLLTLLMLLGRLELFAILVLFVPAFWRNQ